MEKLAKNVHRLKTVRQERQRNTLGNVTIKYSNKHFEVKDYTAFSLAVFMKPGDFLNAISAELFVSDSMISEISLEYIRDDIDELGIPFCAFRVVSDPIDLTQLTAAIKSHKVILEKENEKSPFKKSIPDAFRIATYELKDWLEDLERRVQSISIRSFETPEHYLNEYENTICQIVSYYLAKELPQWFHRLQQVIDGKDEETINSSFQFFREKVGPFLYQSYYSHRAYTKPLGYAGDFEMMNTVYQRDKRGDTLFGKCIHTYFTDVPEAKAVRNRANYLLSKLENRLKASKGPKKILAVASGPAQELQDLFREQKNLIAPGTEFHLLDQDEAALQYSQKVLLSLIAKSGIDAKVFLHKRQIKEVISQGLDIKDFDLIYSAGLFDYLSDPVASIAANSLYNSLAQGGELIIGNFNVNIPNEFGMSLIMDWHLIYRSEDDLIRLFKPTTERIVVEKEPEGINLFAVMDKNAA